jgi:hypothetical protein
MSGNLDGLELLAQAVRNVVVAPAHNLPMERNGRGSFTIDEIKKHHYKLDAFKWIRDEELDDPDNLPEPEELITEAMEELQLALDNLADIQKLLEGNGNGSES